MSEDKRKRSPNWLPSEKELLLDLVQNHINIIENKKTDGFTMKQKLAKWQLISNHYNSRTTNCSRSGENLKAQWESMKKMARKDAANHRRHMIRTGGGSPLPPKKVDPFLQRVLSVLSTSAVGLINVYDSDDNELPQVQVEVATPRVKTEKPETPTQCEDITFSPIVSENHKTDVVMETQESVEKDWGDYTPELLTTPVSSALRTEKQNTQIIKKTGVSRRRPIHSVASSSLEKLRIKKIEAIDFQTQLAMEENKRAEMSHDLDMEIKKEKLKQEKIKTSILLLRRRKLMNRK